MPATHAREQECPAGDPCPGHSFLDPATTVIAGTAWNPRIAQKYGVSAEETVDLVETSERGIANGCYSTFTDSKGETFYILTLLGQWYLSRVRTN